MFSLDLNGFFLFLAAVTCGLTVLGCFAIYFGVSFKKGNTDVNIISGRYEQDRLAKLIKEAELLREMQSEPPLDDDDDEEDEKDDRQDGRKDNNKPKKTYH
jgi:hypothetical protein